MYPVSEQFLQTIRQPVIDYYIDGTIGSVEFDESNIVTGSFHIQNQCTDTSDVILGSVYTGSLTATFYGLNIPRYSWVGKIITPMFYLHVGNTWQSVPLGVYTIKEAKHSAEGVEITAYDNMIKLDKKFKASKFKTAQKMYQHLTTICTACGLTLGMTEQEIQALPNGNTNLGIVGTKSNKYLSYKKYSNDIDTYRDLVFWIAQSMGTFATINRDGELVFRKYKKTTQAVDEITESYRLAGAVFDDFTTNYTGIYVTNTKDGEEIYYGYDVDELTTAIADTEAAIAENEGERMELWSKYQAGEITEQEYKAAVKPLEKRWKNLEKQLEWLNQALEKAENEEDGLFMDLGENPILQPDGIGSTYAAMRKRVLKALDAISYTPFTCSTVVGVHYDLGDIIQFTGGHATEIGETCCMMAYDFNLNGEFQMQGFGSDPSKPVIKNKNSKKADKADKNGVNSTKVSTGSSDVSALEAGSDGDLYIQTSGGISDEPLQMEHMTSSSTSSNPISVDNFDGDNDSGVSFSISGYPNAQGEGENVYFNLQGLTVGATYNVEFDAQFTRADGGWPWSSYYDNVSCNDMRINLSPDFNLHHYNGTFTYVENANMNFLFPRVNDRSHFTCEFSDIKITPTNTGTKSISYYSDTNNQWNNIDYVRKISGTLSSGKKIGTAENSDDTTTDIYVPNMSGASASAAGSNGLVPAPASGDEGKFLRGDGTWQNAGGGGGSDLELEIDNGEIVATYGAQTEETEPILKDSTGDDIVTMLEAIATEMGALANPEIYAPVVYSTEEREVGVWTDGKPLYQKTYYFTSPSSINTNSTIVDISSLQIDSLVMENGNVLNVPVNWGLQQNYRVCAWWNAEKTELLMNVSTSDLVSKSGVITIQYTKTTDIAGSGHYAALGVPAVHYSTEEHVVGTWIDGKTLYEKTIDCGNMPNSTTKTISIGNIYPKKIEGCMYNPNDENVTRPLPFSSSSASDNVRVDTEYQNLRIVTSANWSSYKAYVTIQYTKP